jgi:sterol desaturase/sphingolipid hydroxylase (fatty acid hydroxylase superfamily)
VIYLVVFDGVNYALHRAQHRFDWWWQLHALHHSQRQMTMWSDNRNHLLDDVLRDSAFVLVGLLIGIAPGQFVAVVAFTQLMESLSHANVRLSFGPVLERVLVSPRYHRLHHAIGLGHESAGPGSLGGHNLAVLFPVWDLLFGTARFDDRYEPTGVRDHWLAVTTAVAFGRSRGWAWRGCGAATPPEPLPLEAAWAQTRRRRVATPAMPSAATTSASEAGSGSGVTTCSKPA